MSDFLITGVEVIQAVQKPDNSVPLIGHKTTFVRIYVKSNPGTALTGVLDVAVPGGGPARQLPPLSEPVMATPQGSDRTHWDQSLNFKLDDDLTAPGRRTMTAFVARVSDLQQGPAEPKGPGSHPLPIRPGPRPVRLHPSEAVREFWPTFGERVDLHTYGLVWAVIDQDDNQNEPIGPAAPWSDFEAHRQYVENVYPVSTLTIDPIPGIGTNPPSPQPFTNLLGSRMWAQAEVQNLPSGSRITILDNWYTGGLHGLAWVGGCETQNVRGLWCGVVMAQEIAHTLGLWWHTFTPNTPYPRPDGSIGSDEIGIDIRGVEPTLMIGSEPVYDIMSYNFSPGGGPPINWTSAFTYGQLITAIASPPASAAPGKVMAAGNRIIG